MHHLRKRTLPFLLVLVAAVALLAVPALAAEGEVEYVSRMYDTFWSLVPPLVAIGLALITKEVYTSLLAGCVVGALFYANFQPMVAANMLFSTLIEKVSGNLGIVLFLVFLGIVVILMTRSGGSAAYGNWAREHIKTRKGAILSTFALGLVLAVDDYFNCLTTGSVMRPVTDTHNISRAKLAYIIDATAAPICIIMPISSWAAAVSGVVTGYDGFQLFVRAIPYNFYALLTIVMMVTLAVTNLDYGPMSMHERNAQEKGDLYTTADRPYANVSEGPVSAKGRVIDLVLPVLVLIASCVVGLIYTGGFFEGVGFIESFANCSAPDGLMLGSAMALVIICIFYLVRRVMSFKGLTDCLPEGFKAMVPAVMILTFAWTISGITNKLGADVFVARLVNQGAESFQMFLPAIVFLVACFLAFATGTSWGTFGILIPIVVAVFPPTTAADGTAIISEILIISISACMAGAVCGDHCSPISDTTIMASTGAQCNHINHVSTQLPYALTVAGVSCVSYIIAGLVQNVFIALPVGIVLMLGTLLGIRAITKKNTPVAARSK